jgi:hypothetical protein
MSIGEPEVNRPW